MQTPVNTLLSKIFTRQETPLPPQNWESGYRTHYLSQTTQVFSDGTANIRLAVYLPRGEQKPDAFSVEVKLLGEWQALNPPNGEKPYWWLELERIPQGTELAFRYQKNGEDWQTITPLNDLASRYEQIYVPALRHEWKHNPPAITHGRVLMETTLEGLLAGYKGGKYAPNNLEEDIANQSLAQRILKTDIPGCLAQLGIDEIMVPVGSSVADRSHLNPKYNYLTYNFVDLDWQIGTPQEFKRLVDRFYEEKIQIIPDLIFAHQVRKPFPGSMDQVEGLDTGFVDHDAYLFRDYGTWMLNLSLPEIRRMLIEKIIGFIKKYRLKIIRIDYIDGLILQYCQRDHNHAEDFLRELKAEMRQACPEVITLGETFEVSQNEIVQDFIDVFYAPMGFSIVEELYKPVGKRDHHLAPNIGLIADHVRNVVQSQRPEAVYAQLHDETWYCPHIMAGRPHVDWAYGGHPAQLAKNQGDELVEMGALDQHHLLDYVRRTVRNAEALTMFIAKSRYMFTPGVDALSLGALDNADEWKMQWSGSSTAQLETWEKTGLSGLVIYHFHQQHRQDMIQLRNIFRRYTKVDVNSGNPLVFPEMNHCNGIASLISIFRRSHYRKDDSLLIIFNLGTQTFEGEHSYELPAPEGFSGRWEVLFDGECFSQISQQHLQEFQTSTPYPQGTLLNTIQGEYSNVANVIPVRIGARSIIVLKYRED